MPNICTVTVSVWGTPRSCTRRLRQRGGTSQRHIYTGGVCSGIRLFQVRYTTMIWKRCVMWLGRDERVEPEITVSNFW